MSWMVWVLAPLQWHDCTVQVHGGDLARRLQESVLRKRTPLPAPLCLFVIKDVVTQGLLHPGQEVGPTRQRGWLR